MPHPDHEKNRRLWNETTDIHYRHPDYKVKEFLRGASTLRSIELEEVGQVSGRRLLHLFCQFGLDTLSWARAGAIVTGIDISDRSIERARELAAAAGLPATFIRSDVMDLIGQMNEKFDIVFQSYGTHAWISDLDKWAAVVAHYLAPGGMFYVVDFHPVAAIWDEKGLSYFDEGPHRYRGEPDYCDKNYISQSEHVEWQHTLGNIVNALFGAGLTIRSLREFDKCAYPKVSDWLEKDGFYYPPDGPPGYPLMFSLKAVKYGT